VRQLSWSLNQGYLPKAMEEAAFDVTAFRLPAAAHKTPTSDRQDPDLSNDSAATAVDDFGEPTTDDLALILQARTGYERRLTAFFSLRGS
jgi:hypothetical protein